MPGVPIGLSNLYYAKLTTDTSSSVAYETPVRIMGAITANINPNSDLAALHADDAPYEVASTIGQIELELSAAGLELSVIAELLGHTVTGGVMKRLSTDTPPWVAIGFKAKKSNGNYRYIWLLKGRFAENEQNHETKGDSINFQPLTLRGSFVKRDYDNAWIRETDEDHDDYLEATGTAWFDDPDGAADTTPPTVTVVPVDGAVGQVAGVNVVWTFSEAIQASCIIGANFFVYDAADQSAVAGALSYNTARTEVTFNPTENLTSGHTYIAVVTTNIKDMAGNALAAPSVTDFTIT